MTLRQRFDKALAKYIEREKKDPKVIGILVSGSYYHSELDKNSDIDTYVITEDTGFRERGNTWIDGVEIEYFKNPVKQIRYYFKQEKGKKAPCTAHMFANGKAVYKKSKKVDSLIDEANRIIKQPMKVMTELDIEWAKYALDDLQKDLEDIYERKEDFAFYQISMDILEHCFTIFFQTKKLPSELWLARKPKNMGRKIREMDERFARLYKQALLENNKQKKYKVLLKLIEYVEKELGGKRGKEWVLKSKCTFT